MKKLSLTDIAMDLFITRMKGTQQITGCSHCMMILSPIEAEQVNNNIICLRCNNPSLIRECEISDYGYEFDSDLMIALHIIIEQGHPSKDQYIDITSSVMKSVYYDENLKILFVEFHSGSIWIYLHVEPTVYTDLLNCESKGKFFNANIKSLYKTYHLI